MSPRTPSSCNFAGTPERHRAAGHLHAAGHQRARADERAGADDRAVQHDRAGPDQRAVLDRAAFEVREVTDRAVVADDGLELARAVQHRAVLDRRARADDDAALVATQHRLRPDRRPRPDDDVADDRRLLGCTNASGSICGSMSPRAYRAMDADTNLTADETSTRARQGSRRAGLHDRRGRDRARPRRRAQRRPANGSSSTSTCSPPPNSFEGHQHAARLQPARVRRALSSACRCTSTCCRSSRACSIPAA